MAEANPADAPGSATGVVGDHRDAEPPPRAVGAPVPTPAPETARLYAADWADFSAWCSASRRSALPASPGTLAAYLQAVGPAVGRGALGRRRAAVRAMHRACGHPPPELDLAAKAAVRAACPNAAALRAARLPSPRMLVRIASSCRGDLQGTRDRALLLLAAAVCQPAGTRRDRSGAAEAAEGGTATQAALLGLDAEDVRFTAGGVTLMLRARAGDAAPGRRVDVPRSPAGANTCPVRALEHWLRLSDTGFGPVFRKVGRWGSVEHARLGPDGMRRIVARLTGATQRRGPLPGGGA